MARPVSLFLIAILGFSLIVRVGYSLQLENRLYTDDAADYHDIAVDLSRGIGYSDHGTPKIDRPPGFPFFLAGIYAIFGKSPRAVRIVLSLIGVLNVLFIYLIAGNLWDVSRARLAALIASIHPMFIYFSGALLSETVFLFFLLSATWMTVQMQERSGWLYPVSSGILWGLATLTRPVTIAFLIVPLLVGLIFHRRLQGLLKKAALLLFFSVLTIAPWTIRNWVVFDHFVPVSAMAGIFIYFGNNPTNTTGGGNIGEDSLYPPGIEKMGEIERDRYLLRLGLDWIRANPGQFLRLSVKKFLLLWKPFPRSKEMGWLPWLAVGLSFLTILPFFLYGMLKGLPGWDKLWLLYLFIVYVTVFHMVTTAGIRYRMPIEPFIVIFAANGFATLWETVRGFGKREMAGQDRRERLNTIATS